MKHFYSRDIKITVHIAEFMGGFMLDGSVASFLHFNE